MMSTQSKLTIEAILTGGDERIDLRHNGLNKYHINQLEYEGLLNRGSCTVSTLNEESTKAIQEKLDIINDGNVDFKDLVEEQRTRLESYISLFGNFDIILAPSGSDLVYLPILFAKILYPDQSIVNMLSCPEELGSGSIFASEAKYYMDYNQFNEKVPRGEKVSDDLHVDLLHFNARSGSGHILNHRQTIIRELSNYPNKTKILSLVVGSKSGIKDNLDILDQIDKEVFKVIDLCQFRTTKEFIYDLVKKDCLVMITGSKFYQSPPFCGAMLVPKSMTARMNQKLSDHPNTYNFKSLFSYYDFPNSMSKLANEFPKFTNYGLYLRWEAALSEMETYYHNDFQEIDMLSLEWNRYVTNFLENRLDYFELMPNQELTNDSIISFRIIKNGRHLTHQELKYLHQHLLKKSFSNPYFTRVNIGQPVQYGDKSFIRLAVGSKDIRDIKDRKEKERFFPDQILLEELVSFIDEINFDELDL